MKKNVVFMLQLILSYLPVDLTIALTLITPENYPK